MSSRRESRWLDETLDVGEDSDSERRVHENENREDISEDGPDGERVNRDAERIRMVETMIRIEAMKRRAKATGEGKREH